MPGARRAPPLPPSKAEQCPPPLPSRPGGNARTKWEPEPPPLPSRPVAAAECADDMYEDMNAVRPQIIDAKPNKKKISQTPLLPSPSANFKSPLGNRFPANQLAPMSKPKTSIRPWDSFRETGSSSSGRALGNDQVEVQKDGEKQRRSTLGEMGRPVELQHETLVMDEMYERPLAQAGFPGNFTNQQQQRNEIQDFDEDASDGWSESDFDDVDDNIEATADETYECPDGQLSQSVTEDIYEKPDEGHIERPQPPSQAKKLFGSNANAPGININPATLQMSKMKLGSVSPQEPSHCTAKGPALNREKPQPPPKSRSNTGMGGSSIVKALADSLNARRAGMKSLVDKVDAKENPPEDNSSTGPSSSQSAAEPASCEEVRRQLPSHPSTTSKPEKPSVPKIVPVTPKKAERQQTLPEDDCDIIYDEAVSESLYAYDWYHGLVDRKEAESRVKSLREDGAFLIRESSRTKSKNTNPDHRYTLVVLNNNKIHNLIIRQRSDDCYALGKEEKFDEVTFLSLQELVEVHRTRNVRLLKEGEVVKLASSPQRC